MCTFPANAKVLLFFYEEEQLCFLLAVDRFTNKFIQESVYKHWFIDAGLSRCRFPNRPHVVDCYQVNWWLWVHLCMSDNDVTGNIGHQYQSILRNSTLKSYTNCSKRTTKFFEILESRSEREPLLFTSSICKTLAQAYNTSDELASSRNYSSGERVC